MHTSMNVERHNKHVCNGRVIFFISQQMRLCSDILQFNVVNIVLPKNPKKPSKPILMQLVLKHRKNIQKCISQQEK